MLRSASFARGQTWTRHDGYSAEPDIPAWPLGPSIDVGEIALTHSELQAYVNSASRAAAMQIDGTFAESPGLLAPTVAMRMNGQYVTLFAKDLAENLRVKRLRK
jgi:hypothetical protein